MGSTSSSSSMMMMTPYLHFTGGDNLFFKSWKPSSPGAIAGACIGLLFLALLERGLAAVRGHLEAQWRRRSLAITSGKRSDRSSTPSSIEMKDIGSGSKSVRSVKGTRMFAPFIPLNDVSRGLVFALQVFLGYILMLAVMTYNAAYIVTIILGLGIGEMAFGRFPGMQTLGPH